MLPISLLGVAAAVFVLALILFLAFSERCIQSLEKIAHWVASLSGSDVDSLGVLLSPVGTEKKNEDGEDFVLAQTNGDLVSVIEFRGARKYIGFNDYGATIQNFSRTMEKLLKAGSIAQHSFSLGFRSDPEKSASLVDEILLPLFNTASRLGIDEASMGLLRARREVLSNASTDETVYLVIRTLASAISPHEKKTQLEIRRKQSQAYKEKAGEFVDYTLGQMPAAPRGSLLPKHLAAVSQVVEEARRDLAAGGSQLLLNLLSTHHAIAIVKKHLDASLLPRGWRPRLFGDKPSAATAYPQPGAASLTLPQRITRQLITSPINDHFGSYEVAQMGQYWYASVVLEIMPDTGSERFSVLAERIGRKMPWRAAYDILPNGLGYRTMARVHAAVFSAFSDSNKSIRQAFDQLRQIEQSGTPVCAYRLTLSTWAKSRAAVESQLANLQSAVQSWGGAGCTNETGDPAKTALTSAAGFTNVGSAPFLPVPLNEATTTLPLARPASIWDEGQLICTTPEGRLYPIEFGSRKQNYWSTVGFAPTGTGKSFTLNVINSGLLLSPGAQEVPPITLVDVGKSGKLVMDWYQSILPENLRHQVLSITLQNTHEFTVNPFDTQHGYDKPLDVDMDYLVAVLETIVPGLGNESGKFFERLIRVAYEKYDRMSPDAKRWQNSLDRDAAAILERHNYAVKETTTVWEVVDFLFERGHLAESVSAQRYAMPTLADLSRIASDARVSQFFATARVGDEGVIDIFVRNISTGLDSYAIMSGYTQFNIGAARAVAIDLGQVVGATSEEGRRRSGLMYLMARRIGARNYFLKWDEMERNCPAMYADYQKKRVSKLWGTMKFLQYDESHYFSNISSVTNLVHSDLRTGRKYNLITAMFSQLLDDFPKEVVENTYIFLIMGMGDSSPELVRQTFGLSEDEMQAIATHCVRPGRLFARFKTSHGVLSQPLNVVASAYEQFAFTTQGSDPQLRDELVKVMPYDEAIAFLAKRFPDGTSEPYFRKLIASRGGAKDVSDESLAKQVSIALLAEAGN